MPLILIASCASSAPKDEDTAISSSTAALQTTASSAVQVRSGVDNAVVAQVLPNAACTVCPADVTAGGDCLELPSDDTGHVTFYYNISSLTGVHTLLVNCQDLSGKAGAYSVQLQASANAPALTAPAPQGTVRPALMGDPLSYTDSQLVALGFPPRPDSTQAPDKYRQWLRLVSTAATKVSVRPIPMHGLHPSIDWWGWAGYRVTSHPIYSQVQAEWQIPYPYGETNNLGVADTSSLWVGLGDGGPSHGDMWQGGSEQDVTCYYMLGDIGCVRGYYSWVEVISSLGCPMIGWDMGFRPWHYVYVGLWIGDINGNPNPSLAPPLYPWWYFWDETTNAYYADRGGWYYVDNNGQPHCNGCGNPPDNDGRLPYFVQFTGGSAEWIVERTSGPVSPPHLADFGTALMMTADFYNASENWQAYQYDNPEQITMTSNGNSNDPVLATANQVQGYQDRIQFQWYRFY
jgi:hypothetical protein